jgi:hypothetical protein
MSKRNERVVMGNGEPFPVHPCDVYAEDVDPGAVVPFDAMRHAPANIFPTAPQNAVRSGRK